MDESRTFAARGWRRVMLASGALVLAACHSDHTTGLTTRTCATAAQPIALSALQAAIVACDSGPTIQLPGGNGDYLIVPQFAAGDVSQQPVSYVMGAPGVAPTPVVAAVRSVLIAPRGPGLRQMRFDALLRSRARTSATGWRTPGPSFTISGAPGIRASTVPPLSSLRAFHVLASDSGITFKTVTAKLDYIGSNILIYVDTASPPNGFGSTELNAFGQQFDQALYPLDIQTFGSPTDIDGNGHVIMLLSPVVNALTPSSQCATQGYIAGFFDPVDLGDTTDPNSNKGEIFYAIVPDSTGSVSCPHSVADAERALEPTFLHELQHMISFSQHFIVHGGQEEEGWLDEGMSLIAEELGSIYYEQKYPPPLGRTNPAQIFPDSAEPFIIDDLIKAYDYGLDPTQQSVTLHSDADGGLAWRGGDWLLLRWLGDQKGASFYRTLEQSSLTGTANIAAAAGESFPSLFGDFSLALYTDSLPGVARTSIPPRDRFVSRNLRYLFQALYNAAGGPNSDFPRPFPIQYIELPAGGALSTTMVPGTMTFFHVAAASSSGNITIRFASQSSGSTSGGVFPSTLKAQVSIFRLD